MTRSLIVGVDDTDDGRNALARAAEWARVAGLRLVVVHVRHIPVLTEMSSMTIGPARQNLDLIEAAVRQATEDALQGTDADWEFVVRSGDPAHELMAVARDRAALAIIVGGRPHKAALSGLAGSVSAAWSTGSTAQCSSSAAVTKRGTPRPVQARPPRGAISARSPRTWESTMPPSALTSHNSAAGAPPVPLDIASRERQTLTGKEL